MRLRVRKLTVRGDAPAAVARHWRSYSRLRFICRLGQLEAQTMAKEGAEATEKGPAFPRAVATRGDWRSGYQRVPVRRQRRGDRGGGSEPGRARKATEC